MTTVMDGNSVDQAWEMFCMNPVEANSVSSSKEVPAKSAVAPDPSPIYISTKTKIAYLNSAIDLDKAFWGLELIDYHLPDEGIIKKQMKFNSRSPTELEVLREKAEQASNRYHLDEHVMSSSDPENERSAFKDVRKLSFGLCRHDIMSDRRRQRGAFYNCFVTIVRVNCDGNFREIHVKVFNTGKLEVPGIQKDELLDHTLRVLSASLRSVDGVPNTVAHVPSLSETVLINSNFNCGFFIDRPRLHRILSSEYSIHCTYDPCSYPGVQCAFYHDASVTQQTGRQVCATDGLTKVSFMVFRTGSVLIVGKCTEKVLHEVYEFLCSMLAREYGRIQTPSSIETSAAPSQKRSKKRTIRTTCA